MQTGTIVRINPRNGMFIVRFESGAYCVLELFDSIDIEVGDQIRGGVNALGPHMAFHVGQGQAFEVIGQTGECSLQYALSVAGLVM